MQTIDLTKMLQRGLEPDSRARSNSGYPSTLTGAVATPYGLRAPEEVQELVTGLSISHPFPQLLRGRSITLLADRTALYEVDESDWSTSALVTYDFFDTGSTKGISAGGTWEFADFYSTWFLSNGSCLVFKTGWKDASKVFVINDPVIRNVCEFRGRFVHAGYSGTFWNAEWQALWTLLVARGFGSFGLTLGQPGLNWAGWASIAGGDAMQVFDSTLATTGNTTIGGYSSERPLFIDLAKRAQSGYMPIGWPGSSQAMFPSRQGVYVATDSGLSILLPFSEPVPTFGCLPLLAIGAAGRGALGGGGTATMFIDASGAVWVADTSLMPVRVGHESVFREYLGGNFIVSYSPLREEFYISVEDRAFVLGKNGLSELLQSITNVFALDGALSGVCGTAAEQGVFETGPLDFGTRKSKFLQAVEVGLRNNTECLVTVSYRDSVSDAWTAIAKPTDRRGRVQVNVEAVEFKVRLTADTLEVDSLLLEVEEQKIGVGTRG